MGVWNKIVVEPLISCACGSKPILKQREKVVPLATGQVMEIGCGAGTNFDFYDFSKVTHVDAIEPAQGMLKRARKKADAARPYGSASDLLRCRRRSRAD